MNYNNNPADHKALPIFLPGDSNPPVAYSQHYDSLASLASPDIPQSGESSRKRQRSSPNAMSSANPHHNPYIPQASSSSSNLLIIHHSPSDPNFPKPKKRKKGPSGSSPRVPCLGQGCNKEFGSISDRNRHWEASCKSNPNKVKFPCPKCSFPFGRKDSLAKHVKEVSEFISSWVAVTDNSYSFSLFRRTVASWK